MLKKDAAICTRVSDYSETSQIATFFTRANGKISVIAKGSKRPKSPFGGPIEILCRGRIVFSDTERRKLATLTEFEQQGTPSGLAGNLLGLNCCYFAAELVNRLTHEHDPHQELYDSFEQFLEDILCSEDTLSLLILFQLSLLNEIGLKPVLNRCANCGARYEMHNTRYEIYFSSGANGLVCGDCEASFSDKIKLNKQAADCLANLRLLADADQKTVNEIEKILISHFTEILGSGAKMAKHILKNS